ncbi:Uncharacterized protein AArcCO_4153 (plasmid) [Halalkaliarchaeum sp. AArc-CO]|nr:Uncharacterized protein AArcCO_4153 [Halalkaliarchaeum sp. AArc-CO]
MSSEKQQSQMDVSRHPTLHTDASWFNLAVTVPNDRSLESVISLVECVLVEMTHEDVGAEYISSNVWGAKRTQFVAIDEFGEQFRKQHYDARLGWHETTVSRSDVREELVNRLSRSTTLRSNKSHCEPVVEPDIFSVKPTRRLRRALSDSR